MAQPVCFRCRFRCGFKRFDEDEVQAHEFACERNPDAEFAEGELAEGEVFECEFECGFEHADRAVVEEHEEQCERRPQGRRELRERPRRERRSVSLASPGDEAAPSETREERQARRAAMRGR